jgi:AAA ATPase domain
MTIRAVRLQNFRGFRKAEIGLKPLTVLLGPNSAGKSSFGQAIAAMSYAQWQYSGGKNASLTPSNSDEADKWPVDFGFHADLVTSGVQDRVFVGLETTAGWVDFGFGLVPGERELKLSSIAHPGSLASNASTERPVTSDSYLAVHPVSPPIVGAQTGIGEIVAVTHDQRFHLTRKNEQDWYDNDKEFTRVGLDGLLLTSVQHGDGGTNFFVERAARQDIEHFLSSISYLRANRKRPTRSNQYGAAKPQPIGYEGEFTSSVLHDQTEDGKRIKCLFPTQIPSSIDEARNLIDAPWPSEELELLPALGKWLHHLGLASDVSLVKSPHQKGNLETKVVLTAGLERRNITEVGFGVSQVLPVIVAGLIQPRDGTLIVELPEAHLHPRAQAELADFFCSLVLSGQSVIVETHSEMFFHRLRLRAAMSTKLMEKIAIYFCDAPSMDGCCICPRQVGLTLDEELTWPSGFLQEAWEMETEIGSVREARKKNP